MAFASMTMTNDEHDDDHRDEFFDDVAGGKRYVS